MGELKDMEKDAGAVCPESKQESKGSSGTKSDTNHPLESVISGSSLHSRTSGFSKWPSNGSSESRFTRRVSRFRKRRLKELTDSVQQNLSMKSPTHSASFNFKKHSFEDFHLRHTSKEKFEEGRFIEVEGNFPRVFYLRHHGPGNRLNFWCRQILAWVSILWVPFAVCFSCAIDLQGFWKADLALEMVAVVSTILQFRTSYVNLLKGKEFVEPSAMIKYRLQDERCVLELLSLLSLFAYSFGGNPLAPAGNSSMLFSRCLLCLRMGRGWRLASPDPADVALHRGVGAKRGFLAAVTSLGQLFINFFVVGHITTCVWYAAVAASRPCLLSQDNISAKIDETLSDLPFYDLRQLWSAGSDSTFWTPTSAYQAALLDTLNLLTAIGAPFPTTESERVCLLVLVPFGAFVMGFVLAQLVVILTSLKMMEQRRNDHLNLIQSAMVSLQLPGALQNRILQYHQYMQVQHDENAANALFTGLSNNLKVELKLVLFQGLIENSELLRGATPYQISELVVAFQEEVYSPGDLVVKKGDVGNEMFFIMKGRLEVLGDELQIYCQKKIGEYFGEVCALIPGQTRTAWIRAKTFCVLAKLTHERVAQVFSEDHRKEMLQRVTGFANVVKAISLPANNALRAWVGNADPKVILKDVVKAWAQATREAKEEPPKSTSLTSKDVSPRKVGGTSFETDISISASDATITPKSPDHPAKVRMAFDCATELPASMQLNRPMSPGQAFSVPKTQQNQPPQPPLLYAGEPLGSVAAARAIFGDFREELVNELRMELHSAASSPTPEFCQQLIKSTVSATVRAMAQQGSIVPGQVPSFNNLTVAGDSIDHLITTSNQ